MPTHDEMSQNESNPTKPGSDSVNDASSPARRRALLKGLGKTAAIAGAAMPLRSLAGSGRMRLKKTDNKNYNCSVSGNMSVMLSTGADALPQCSGKPPSHYCSNNGRCDNDDKARWTNWWNDGASAVCYKNTARTLYCRPTTSFNSVFGSGPSTMIGALCNLAIPTEETHWVTALLNSNVRETTFPHSPEQVIALYGSSNRAAAYAFFKDWMVQG